MKVLLRYFSQESNKEVVLLSHKKVTKRLWPAASYGKIGVVGYRLLQERDG